MAETKDRIKQWIPVIEGVRTDYGLTADQYPTWILLSLIQIESAGNEHAHRSNSQYYGLLQIGHSAAADVNRRNTYFDGNGVRSIEAFYKRCERYSRGPKRHNYDAEKIAIMWKSGPGTLASYNRIQRTQGQDAAEDYLRTLWGGSSYEYLRRFRTQAAIWSNGDAQVRDPGLPLPSSRRSVSSNPNVASSTTSAACGPHAPNVQKLSPNQELAKLARTSALAAMQIQQGAGANGFRTDLTEPFSENRVPQRTFQLLENNRLVTATAVFDHETFRTFAQPLVAPVVATGFSQKPSTGGAPIRGVEYDTSADSRQTVHAIADGTVVSVAVTVERGNVVTINHADSVVSVYGHLSEVFVSAGESVTVGATIARAGRTLGVENELAVIAVPRATTQSRLYLEIRGLSSLWVRGASNLSKDFSVEPLPVDPVAVLRGAPEPGQIQVKQPAELKMFGFARDAYAELALNAPTMSTKRSALDAYDGTTAAARARSIAGLDRAAYAAHDKSQGSTRVALAHTQFALDASEF